MLYAGSHFPNSDAPRNASQGEHTKSSEGDVYCNKMLSITDDGVVPACCIPSYDSCCVPSNASCCVPCCSQNFWPIMTPDGRDWMELWQLLYCSILVSSRSPGMHFAHSQSCGPGRIPYQKLSPPGSQSVSASCHGLFPECSSFLKCVDCAFVAWASWIGLGKRLSPLVRVDWMILTQQILSSKTSPVDVLFRHAL